MDCVKSISALAALAAFTAAPAAFAHISLEQGGTHLSRYGESYLKDLPCGKAGGTRGTNIYTYAPGATITVSFVETIPHPSYFRFAFQQSGDDEFKEPASIKPIDPSRPCPIDSGDHCDKVHGDDFYNTPNVLPMMDDLSPHLAGSGGTKYTYQVTLPNVECDNCTLQIIQVMEDNAFHGDYDPTPGVGVEDLYHQCIDLVLKAGTPPGPDMAGTGGTGGGGGGGSGGSGGSGGAGGSGGSGGTGGSGGSGTGGNGASKGGCSMAGRAPVATGLLFACAAFALLALRRRPR